MNYTVLILSIAVGLLSLPWIYRLVLIIKHRIMYRPGTGETVTLWSLSKNKNNAIKERLDEENIEYRYARVSHRWVSFPLDSERRYNFHIEYWPKPEENNSDTDSKGYQTHEGGSCDYI